LIRLVVGLGNPGKEYERTRHNAGFWLVERFASASGIALRKDPKFQALVGRHEASGAWLLEPQSFMNASGRAVQMLAGFFKVKPEEILVVHDELDFAPGVARVKQGGGIAGRGWYRGGSLRHNDRGRHGRRLRTGLDRFRRREWRVDDQARRRLTRRLRHGDPLGSCRVSIDDKPDQRGRRLGLLDRPHAGNQPRVLGLFDLDLVREVGAFGA